MGGKGRRAEVIKVNPRDVEGRRMLPCFMEMMAFMSCLKASSFDNKQCMEFVNALNDCVDNQARKGKARSTLNYHLQRIARQMRK